MPSGRYYVNCTLSKTDPVVIEAAEAHHLIHVMRAQKGESIEVINGEGKLADCTLTQIEKSKATATVQHLREDPRPTPLIAALALTRQNHLEWAIEKGTELNASAFFLFPGEYSERDSLSPNQKERLVHLTIAATKQSGRLYMPAIVYKPPLKSWDLGSECASYRLLICDPLGDTPLSATDAPTLFFIGPEKGFSPQELEKLSNLPHAKRVRLHKNILRAETAPLVALSLLN